MKVYNNNNNNNNNNKKEKKKRGPIICTVENEIPKYQTGYMQNSFLKSRDFSNLHFVGKMGQKNKY